MTPTDYLLKKEAIIFVESCIKKDYSSISSIIARQTNSAILTFGFDTLRQEKKEEDIGTNWKSSDKEIIIDYKLNLLEFLTTASDFYPDLKRLLSNDLVAKDLRDCYLKECISQNTYTDNKYDETMSIKSFVQVCLKDKELKKILLLVFSNDEINNLLQLEKTKTNKLKN